MVTTILAAIFTPITIFVVFARLWVRFRLQRNAGIDDWLMVAALVIIILSHEKFHPLILQKPFVIALAILVPWSKITKHSSLSTADLS